MVLVSQFRGLNQSSKRLLKWHEQTNISFLVGLAENWGRKCRLARAINKSYIDVVDPKNRNIDGISAPSNNNLVFKLMGCLGPSPGALYIFL